MQPFYPLTFLGRPLWDELQTHARTGVAVGLSMILVIMAAVDVYANLFLREKKWL